MISGIVVLHSRAAAARRSMCSTQSMAVAAVAPPALARAILVASSLRAVGYASSKSRSPCSAPEGGLRGRIRHQPRVRLCTDDLPHAADQLEGNGAIWSQDAASCRWHGAVGPAPGHFPRAPRGRRGKRKSFLVRPQSETVSTERVRLEARSLTRALSHGAAVCTWPPAWPASAGGLGRRRLDLLRSLDDVEPERRLDQIAHFADAESESYRGEGGVQVVAVNTCRCSPYDRPEPASSEYSFATSSKGAPPTIFERASCARAFASALLRVTPFGPRFAPL